jgi:hypothetical protein
MPTYPPIVSPNNQKPEREVLTPCSKFTQSPLPSHLQIDKTPRDSWNSIPKDPHFHMQKYSPIVPPDGQKPVGKKTSNPKIAHCLMPKYSSILPPNDRDFMGGMDQYPQKLSLLYARVFSYRASRQPKPYGKDKTASPRLHTPLCQRTLS